LRASPSQALLLRAALLTGEPGLASWHAWRRDADLDVIDRGSARLLPLVWFNLLANGVSDPWLPRFKGIYRHTWFGNQVWMRRVREIQGLLAKDDIEPVFLKGIALANAYYPNPGLRPMDDLDILVEPGQVSAALVALAAGGWATAIERPEMVLRTVHGVELISSADQRLDLHAHLLQGSLSSALDARRRARATTIELGDGPLKVLEPTDQLLHVLVHGVESDPPAPRWLADALVIMRRDAGIDWVRLLADAAAESRLLAVSHALDELVAVFGRRNVPVPDEAFAAVHTRRPSLEARFEQRVASGPRVPVIGYALQRTVDYRRWRRSGGRDPERRAGFAAYLRLNWGLDSRRALPAQAARRGTRTALADLRAAGARRRRANGATDRFSNLA
jgi:Uncharacterised nucleotidyltransferase